MNNYITICNYSDILLCNYSDILLCNYSDILFNYFSTFIIITNFIIIKVKDVGRKRSLPPEGFEPPHHCSTIAVVLPSRSQ